MCFLQVSQHASDGMHANGPCGGFVVVSSKFLNFGESIDVSDSEKQRSSVMFSVAPY
jgi:hypothetical protein